MNFILIFGPPAVGKMTVGDAIRTKTGIPLMHNHLAIEPALKFFPYGTPSFHRFVETFRRTIFEETINSGRKGLIFTFAWDLDDEEDNRFVKETCELFETSGAKVILVELKADLSQRLVRNKSEKRLHEKPTKRDIKTSESRLIEAEKLYRLNSNGGLPVQYRHLIIDNTHMSPEEVADHIIDTIEERR
jgi:broad-specificity NMP kinase